MKIFKITTILFILFWFLPQASALTVAWDNNTDSAIGYTLYWQEQGTTEEFRVNLPDVDTTQYIIEDKFLKFDKIYDIWATAYNDRVNSDKSEVITAVRSLTFSPPVSNLPTITYDPEKPSKVTINATP